jgi:threonine dehydrogenase-like Zn-dependent dehydrogenase
MASIHGAGLRIATDLADLRLAKAKELYADVTINASRTSAESRIQQVREITEGVGVEGLVASAGTLANIAKKQNVLDILNLYDRVDENLRRHDPRYPTADQLRRATWEGHSGAYGKPAKEILGEGQGQRGFQRDHSRGGPAGSSAGMGLRLGRLV